MSFAKPDPEKQRVSEIEEREDRDATYGTTNLSADEQSVVNLKASLQS